jgi:hypothetical protein
MKPVPFAPELAVRATAATTVTRLVGGSPLAPALQEILQKSPLRQAALVEARAPGGGCCFTRRMPRRRLIATVLATLALALLALPAIALAGSGSSAGDSQYVDPLAATATHPHSSTTPSSSTPSGSVPTPPAASVTSSPTASVSTATTPAAPTSATTSTAPRTLPFTGIDTWLVAAVGAGLAGAGLVLRRAPRAG